MKIISFKHKGLENFYRHHSLRGIKTIHEGKLDEIFAAIELADDLFVLRQNVALNLHSLAGDLKGFYAIKVDKKWRLTFQYVDEGITGIELVNYVDYH